PSRPGCRDVGAPRPGVVRPCEDVGMEQGLRQAGLPGMPEQLLVCTPSRLAAYEDCPRRYRYAYVDRPAPPKGPPWAHNSLGASVHTALRGWYDLPTSQRRPAALPAL